MPNTMNIYKILFALPLLFISCNKKPVIAYEEKIHHKNYYKDIYEVTNDTAEKGWVELKDKSQSLTLHFFQDKKDTLGFAYSPECWVEFPYKIKNNKITVYWDTIIDTKYNFDLVKAMRETPPKYIGKPFLELSLEDGTILNAHYTEQHLIENINQSVKGRIAFPEKFTISDTIIF